MTKTGNIKMPSFLCEWDSQAKEKHLIMRVSIERKNFVLDIKNILHEPLVNSPKIGLHIN